MDKLLAALKKLLGLEDAKFEELKTLLSTHKVMVDDGTNNIPQSRLNEVIKQREDAKEALGLMEVEVEKLKKLSTTNDELKTQITDAQKKVTDLQTEHETELAKMKKENLITMTFAPLVHDVEALKPFLDYQKITIVDGKAIGLDEQKIELQKNKEFLFKPVTPGKTGDNGLTIIGSSDYKNPFKRESYSVAEQTKLLRADKVLYDKMKKEVYG